jgi:hypothetical protein
VVPAFVLSRQVQRATSSPLKKSEQKLQVYVNKGILWTSWHAGGIDDGVGKSGEPKRKGKRNWQAMLEEKRRAVINNRRRTRGARSKRLQRLRSERVERSFAHVCDTGGARRSWLALWDREDSGAFPDCCRGPQPGLDHAQGVWNWDAEELADGRRPYFVCLFCLASHFLSPTTLAICLAINKCCLPCVCDRSLAQDSPHEFDLFQRAVRQAF